MRMLDALARKSLDRPPVWFMRQAGRYLPEYRELRRLHSFAEATHTPEIAAEITLQPVRRFGLDAAIVFSDIMTPLEAMGVPVEFTPGPSLSPLSLEDVSRLPELDLDRVRFVMETLALARAELPDDVALIGFCGAPFTLMAYLLEGGGSKDFMAVRSAAARNPKLAAEALHGLARSMQRYLEAQIAAGADVVQVFDSWAGLVSERTFLDTVGPAAAATLEGLTAPTIFFAPDASHLLDHFPTVRATGYGVDWRLPLPVAWDRIGRSHPGQGSLDPAVLLTDPETVQREVTALLDTVRGAAGHIFNLGHGIHRASPIENVSAMVAAAKEAS